jgi:hypothetical protein
MSEKKWSSVNLFETPLEYINAILLEELIATDLTEKTEEIPVELLYAMLSEVDGYSYVLKMYYIDELARLAMGDEMPEQHHLLRFSSVYPIPVSELHASDMQTFLHYINRLVPMGSFGFSHNDLAVTYDYTLIVPDQEIPEAFFLNIYYLMKTTILETYPLIGDVAKGNVSAAEAVKQIHQGIGAEAISVLPFPGFGGSGFTDGGDLGDMDRMV